VPLSQILLNPLNIMEIKPTFNNGLDYRDVGGNIKVSWREKWKVFGLEGSWLNCVVFFKKYCAVLVFHGQ